MNVLRLQNVKALDLISRIEDKKLALLRQSTAESRVKIREAVIALNKTLV